MKNISLNIKIFIIFLIPAVALLYFSFYFINAKYECLTESSKYKLSANITNQLSELVHNIQIERGLSAGYLVAKNKVEIEKKLLQQYIQTDKEYRKILHFINLNSKAKKDIIKELGHKNIPCIKKVIYHFSNIRDIRQSILNLSISFEDEILYYTQINTHLINAIESFILILQKQSNDNNALAKLQNLKENAGLERAFVYKQLLSNTNNSIEKKKILELQKIQKIQKKEFILDASISSTLIYTRLMNDKELKELDLLRDSFSKTELNSNDAQTWFNKTTNRINNLEEISTDILNVYIKNSNKIYKDTLNSLYITAFLWLFSLISLSILAYILKNLLKNEASYTEELRILAYTFDSHEAMTITDVQGTIIKVNKAFSTITGYSEQEVIGKNPRVLKSMKHSEEFYKEMWRMLHTEGRWSDEIYNMRKNGEIYPERLSITAIKDSKNITTHYIAQFLDISDLKQAQERAEHQADHDFLTGLANRKQLMQRLHEEFIKARRHNFLHAFLFIDLDNFKKVNDSYGHKVGDLLLQEVTKTLKNIVREEDFIARMSGDEFAILISNINKTEAEAAKDIKEICNKILKKLSEPFIIDTHKLEIGASIGIKLFPDSEKTAQDVIIHADTAMYQAKHQGKNQFVFFDKSIELELRQISLLEEEIKNGFDNNEFKQFYQPKINTKNDLIYGAELLTRWKHPSKGILYPKSFIDKVTELNLINKFTILALHSACDFIQKHGEYLQGTLAINISSKELLSTSFEKNLISIINSYKISPSKIELEITENELIKNFDLALEQIDKLQRFGIQFSIDDFGTGYSSITYLKQLPFNTLKIDRSFLQNLNNNQDRELIEVIVNMAKIFHMNVVAEGIENKFDLDFIKKHDIVLYQGNYFSKAVTQEVFLSMLEESIKH
jgi:diguanylate cyclase (GGDEF)-like protein/PAS domain S-box-containing protein